MPYSVSKDTSACPAGKPFAVKKVQTGAVVPGGCHKTHAQALDHQQAMMANVKDAAVSGPQVRGVARGLYDQSRKAAEDGTS